MDPKKLPDLVKRVVDEEWEKVKSEEGPRITEMFKDELVSRIKNQAFAWVPLSHDYLDYKRRVGLDTRTLIATSDYLNAIRTRQESKDEYVCEPPDNLIHQPSGLDYEFLASIHEYGSKKRKIPARPHWRPLKNEYRQKQKAFEKEIAKKLHDRVLVRLMQELGSSNP